MTFQFQCPQGHLLEGDESQAHEQCHCPQCGLLFVIPAPSGGMPAVEAAAAPASDGLAQTNEPAKILHIPCPNGHILDAPIEMLEQEVLCPHCEVQFRLTERDSREFQRQQELAQERAIELEEFEVGKLWLKWAIVVSVLVAAALLLLIILSS